MLVDRGGADVQISWEHFLVHEGRMFTIEDEQTNVQVATPKRWLIKLGATAKPIHLAVVMAATGGAKIELFESPTTTADGNALAITNLNRVCGLTLAAVTAFDDPTVTGDGTLIGHCRAGGGILQNPASAARPDLEHILRPGLNYQLKATVDVNGYTVLLDCDLYAGLDLVAAGWPSNPTA